MSVKLLIRGDRTTATRSGAGPSVTRRSPTSRVSSLSSQTSELNGSTPYTRRPVSCSSSVSPGPSSDSSPRNRLTTKPATSRWSSGASSATLPKSDANTPPRSMSPTSTVARSPCCARPMLT